MILRKSSDFSIVDDRFHQSETVIRKAEGTLPFLEITQPISTKISPPATKAGHMSVDLHILK